MTGWNKIVTTIGIKCPFEIMRISNICLIDQNSMLFEPKSVLFSKLSGPVGLSNRFVMSRFFLWTFIILPYILVSEPADFKMISVLSTGF